MRSPRPIKWYETTSVDCATEDILGHKFALIPDDHLFILRMSVLALSDIAKPFVVCIMSRASMFQPFVDEHVG